MSITWQFIQFGCVGIGATIIDVGIYNLLTRPAIGWRRIPANIVSVTAGMTFNFFANWLLVFHPAGNDWLAMTGKYLIVTTFSAFVLQNLMIHLATNHWLLPTRLASTAVRHCGLEQRFPAEFVSRNTAKALAIGAGLIWNFCWYKFFVFAG